MIQGFNQDGQGKINLDLYIDIDGMESTALILGHRFKSKTTYNMLLGRPCIHENMVVPSTLHQCFKDGEIKSVAADSNPFDEAESYLIDAILKMP